MMNLMTIWTRGFRSAWRRALTVAVIVRVTFCSGVDGQSLTLPDLIFCVLGEVNTIQTAQLNIHRLLVLVHHFVNSTARIARAIKSNPFVAALLIYPELELVR